MDITIHQVVDEMEDNGGSFAHYLAKAWRHADLVNRSIIENSFDKYFDQYLVAVARRMDQAIRDDSIHVDDD